MLHGAQAKATEAALSKFEFLLTGLGEGKLSRPVLDRAVLVTLFGGIPVRLAASRPLLRPQARWNPVGQGRHCRSVL
jgi:hypothetical protein